MNFYKTSPTLMNALNITQSKLFKDHPPGVFYNLVSRATSAKIGENANADEGDDSVKGIIKTNAIPPIITNSIPPIITNNIPPIITSVTPSTRTIKRKKEYVIKPAKTAYLIMGHGREPPKSEIKHIVPRGCTLVVEIHSGELSYSRGNQKFVDYPNKSIFLDPINNYKELVNAITDKGSLAIYKEGDEYPNLHYSLMLEWDEHNLKMLKPNQVLIRESGIMEYPFKSIEPSHVVPTINIYDINSPCLDIFPEIYRNSIWPRKKTVRSTIKIYHKELKTLKDCIYSRKFISSLSINTTQSEIFKRLKPGVFYTTACRATSSNIRGPGTVYFKDKYGEHEQERQIIKNNVRLPIKTRKNKNQYFIPEIMGHISEAELQRKPYIHKLGLNAVDISTLEAKIASLKKDLFNTNMRLESYVSDLGHWTAAEERYIADQNMTKEEELSHRKNIQFVINYKLKEIDREKKDIAYYQGEIDKNEKLLEKLKLTRLQNKNSSNYTWKKQQKKWGKVTIKNRNNKAPLPEPLSNNQVQGPREDITNSIHDVSNNKERLSHPLNGT